MIQIESLELWLKNGDSLVEQKNIRKQEYCDNWEPKEEPLKQYNTNKWQPRAKPMKLFPEVGTEP